MNTHHTKTPTRYIRINQKYLFKSPPYTGATPLYHICISFLAIFICYNRYPTPLPMHKIFQIIYKNLSDRLYQIQFI